MPRRADRRTRTPAVAASPPGPTLSPEAAAALERVGAGLRAPRTLTTEERQLAEYLRRRTGHDPVRDRALAAYLFVETGLRLDEYDRLTDRQLADVCEQLWRRTLHGQAVLSATPSPAGGAGHEPSAVPTTPAPPEDAGAAGPTPEWSRPISPGQLVQLFGRSSRTIGRWLKDGVIHNCKLTSKSYRVDIEQLPARERDKYREPPSRTRH